VDKEIKLKIGTEAQVSKTAAVESALREFLRARSFWPPSGGTQ
jgi:hypothetical protein